MTMSDAAPPDGWYPDPGSPGTQLRYWRDGRWTEHIHALVSADNAAVAQPGVAAATGQEAAGSASGAQNPPKKRRTGLIVGLVGGFSAVVVAVAAFFVWGLPALTGPQLTTQDDWAYAWAPLQDNVDMNLTFTFPADYDLDAKAAENGDERDTSFAFELFTDSSLTHHADYTAHQYDRGVEIEPGLGASNLRFHWETDTIDNPDDREFEINGGRSAWGVHDTYYLVQKLDEAGTPLEKPIVYPFRVARPLAMPQVDYGVNPNGTLQMSWDAVPGATEYLVAVSSWDGERRQVWLVGSTKVPTWSPPIRDPFSGERETVEQEQNQGLRTYAMWSAAEIEGEAGNGGAVNALDNDTSEYEYGVIATDGTGFSAMQPTDANTVAASLPQEIPLYLKKQQFPDGQIVDSLDKISTRFFFTSVDGATRQTAAYIDPDDVALQKEGVRMHLSGLGTGLGWPMYLTVRDVDAAKAQINAFNERVKAELPTTGLPQVTTISAPIQGDPSQYTPSTTAPDAGYPLSGTDEFTRYLAANLVAREDAIDVSAYVDRAGMPELSDAIGEAVYQNPYVLGYRGYTVKGDIVYVSYANDAETTKRMQGEIASVVGDAVAKVTTSDMSAADKAGALNQWLVDTASYDKAALEAGKATLGFPSGFAHAWDPSGVLLSENGNTGVCASYAAAYKALMDAAGVPSVVVTGDVLDGGGHAWNKVQVDGKWLAVDPTWNDGGDPTEYLMISDAQFTGSAARTQSNDWMVDNRIADYATP